jgi:hypothetical protein
MNDTTLELGLAPVDRRADTAVGQKRASSARVNYVGFDPESGHRGAADLITGRGSQTAPPVFIRRGSANVLNPYRDGQRGILPPRHTPWPTCRWIACRKKARLSTEPPRGVAVLSKCEILAAASRYPPLQESVRNLDASSSSVAIPTLVSHG